MISLIHKNNKQRERNLVIWELNHYSELQEDSTKKYRKHAFLSVSDVLNSNPAVNYPCIHLEILRKIPSAG